jgi:NADH-quinone oxidoreductase subunit J
MVILHRSPVTSALFLVLAFCSLAGLYLLLQAEFLAMVQVIVYAGAIMVLFLFVIMYLNLKRDVENPVQVMVRRAIGWFVGALLVVEGILYFGRGWAVGPRVDLPDASLGGNTMVVGEALYTRYLFPFEITSILLLVAMVGAVVIAKGRGPRVGPEPTGEASASAAAPEAAGAEESR